MRYLKHCLVYSALLASCGTAYILTVHHPLQGTLPAAAQDTQADAGSVVASAVESPTVFEQNRQLEQHSQDPPTAPPHKPESQPLSARGDSSKALVQQAKPQRAQAVTPTKRQSHSATAPAQSSSDLLWLARAIEAEAGGEPYQTKIAVGDVIMNRVHSPLFPNNIHDVLFQVVSGKYAFTCVQNGWIYHTPSAASWDAARAVLYRHENIVPDALVFYVNSKTPANSWVRTRQVIKVMGDMYFAR